MELMRNAAQPVWTSERWRFPGRAERNLRDLSHMSLMVFAATAVAAGIVAGMSLSSNFGIGLSSSFIVVAILFPLLCGLLAKEVWHARKLEGQVKGQEARLGIMGSALGCGDKTPAGLLIVSPELRVQFANQKYLESMLQEPEKVFGWKLQDILAAEGVEDHANHLFARSDPAASCRFKTRVRGSPAGEWPVHITMTRIAPRQGEDRVLVIVEDLFPGSSTRVSGPVESYVC